MMGGMSKTMMMMVYRRTRFFETKNSSQLCILLVLMVRYGRTGVVGDCVPFDVVVPLLLIIIITGGMSKTMR